MDYAGAEWLESYQLRLGDVAARAEQSKASLQRIAATETSRDGTVTVTVNAGGALQHLSFGQHADDIGRDELAKSVIAMARRAQARAAQQVAAVIEPLIGSESAAMNFLRQQVPTPEEPESGPPASKQPPDPFDALNEEQEEELGTGRPREGEGTPRPPARPSWDGEDDEGTGSIFD